MLLNSGASSVEVSALSSEARVLGVWALCPARFGGDAYGASCSQWVNRVEEFGDVLRYFVTTSRGLEDALAEELTELGGLGVEVAHGGASVEGAPELLPNLNIGIATGLRVLVPVASSRCRDGDDLYDLVQSVDWSGFLSPTGRLAVTVVGRGGPQLEHAGFATLRTKDAVVDQFRARFGARPGVDREQPDLRIHVHLSSERVTVSLDASGVSLHRRGYRLGAGDAALRETLAAGILRYAGWRPGSSLVDLTCGSGTFVIEAARRARGYAPGDRLGDLGYWNWRGEGVEASWTRAGHEAALRAWRAPSERASAAPLLGFDVDPAMVSLARENAERAGVGDLTRFEQRDLRDTSDLPAPGDSSVVICNPPYGERMGVTGDLVELYRAIGDTFKKNARGYRGAVLSPLGRLAKSIGLRSRRRHAIWNGGIECRLLLFELYDGTRRQRSAGA